MRIETIVTLKDGTQEQVMAQLFLTGNGGHGNFDAIPNSPLYIGISRILADGNVDVRLKLNMPEGDCYATATLHHFSVQSGHILFDIQGGLQDTNDLLRP
jgi:hypothetical protein